MSRSSIRRAILLLSIILVHCTANDSSIDAADPVTPNASPEARALLNFIEHSYGKQILSGQMWAPWGIDEISAVEQITGKLPAIRGQDNESQAIHGPSVPVPLHECGTIPNVDECFQNKITWSWWMLWHTQHLTRHDRDSLRLAYHHDLVLTRDELPNIMDFLDVKGDSSPPRSTTHD